MDARRGDVRFSILLIMMLAPATIAIAAGPRIQFDMPSVAVASQADTGDDVSIDLVISSLVFDGRRHAGGDDPPVDHLLVRCRMRDPLPIVNYQPKTELQSDFAGPISVTNKDEKIDSFGLSLDGSVHAIGAGRVGADDTRKQSDSTQFQRQAPMQAVVASGTTDRGHGVYFKYRWTAQQVLEGEKPIRITLAAPENWRGGLLDVSVTAVGHGQPLFGDDRPRAVAKAEFVVAVYRQHDDRAAELARELARLDRKLATFAWENTAEAMPLVRWWQKVWPGESPRDTPAAWYTRLIRGGVDPYMDATIQSLPMPVRVTVLDYNKVSRKLVEAF